MTFLTENEKTALAKKISHAESKTKAEIVTVIAAKSDGYRYIPLLWAALVALSLPGLYYAWLTITTGGWLDPEHGGRIDNWLYPIQVLLFFGLCMVFQLPAARMWIIPTAVKRQRAARHAREQFYLQNLHLTAGRTGVLIFVSVAEHYVEIIVDTGIADIIDNDVWEQSVAEFIAHLRRGDIADGFDKTIEQCREILWQHFPATEGRPDELPNHLIEV